MNATIEKLKSEKKTATLKGTYLFNYLTQTLKIASNSMYLGI